MDCNPNPNPVYNPFHPAPLKKEVVDNSYKSNYGHNQKLLIWSYGYFKWIQGWIRLTG